MKKPSNYAPHRIFDSRAETVRELAPLWGVGIRRMREIVQNYCDSGEWEAVFKKIGKRITHAYRIKK